MDFLTVAGCSPSVAIELGCLRVQSTFCPSLTARRSPFKQETQLHTNSKYGNISTSGRSLRDPSSSTGATRNGQKIRTPFLHTSLRPEVGPLSSTGEKESHCHLAESAVLPWSSYDAEGSENPRGFSNHPRAGRQGRDDLNRYGSRNDEQQRTGYSGRSGRPRGRDSLPTIQRAVDKGSTGGSQRRSFQTRTVANRSRPSHEDESRSLRGSTFARSRQMETGEDLRQDSMVQSPRDTKPFMPWEDSDEPIPFTTPIRTSQTNYQKPWQATNIRTPPPCQPSSSRQYSKADHDRGQRKTFIAGSVPRRASQESISLASSVRPPWMSSTTRQRSAIGSSFQKAPASETSRLVPLPTGRPPWVPGPSVPLTTAPQPHTPDTDLDGRAYSISGSPALPSWLEAPDADVDFQDFRGADSGSDVEETSSSRHQQAGNGDTTLHSSDADTSSDSDSYCQPHVEPQQGPVDHASIADAAPRQQWDGSSIQRAQAGTGLAANLNRKDESRRSLRAFETLESKSDADLPPFPARSWRQKKAPRVTLPEPIGNPEVAPMDLPFEFKFSYTETPNVEPIGYREPVVSPFGPETMSRPWTGRAPLKKSKKNKLPRILPEFDSFTLPEHKKGVKPVQAPGPYGGGEGPRYVRTREEVIGKPLSAAEKRELIEDGNQYGNRQLNLGRDGLVHNMLDNIHCHWKRRRVCKVKCKGVPTVDMDNVVRELQDKTGGVVIERRGGTVFLYRGRHYNYRLRPQIPLMLWKPPAPIYPRLIRDAPEGLTRKEANEMRRRGSTVDPIVKLAKNGVYIDLVRQVQAAFQASDLVKVNCAGMNKSDYRKIGAKLKDLVPCVLLSFEKEQILMWRGPPPGAVSDDAESDQSDEATESFSSEDNSGSSLVGSERATGEAGLTVLRAEVGSGLLIEVQEGGLPALADMEISH